MSGAGLLLALALATQSSDTTVYADLATLELMQRARERHRAQDTLVRDYTADVHTRMELRAGRSRFARLLPIWVHETAAHVTWRRPDELHLRIEGVRARSLLPGVEADVAFDSPWFVPRALGDSIRLLSLPPTAALHPLAADAERVYRYAIVDSSTIVVPGRTVRAVAVRVTPRRLAPSMVAGTMWLDRTTGDVVRLSVTFLGEYVWTEVDDPTARDSAAARAGNRWVQRFVTVQADLEYALVDNRYWMPWRQLLSITASINFLVSVAAPARVHTRFSNYRINTNQPVAFTVEPDTTGDHRTRVHAPPGVDPDTVSDARDRFGYARAGRSAAVRWEIAVPPLDSLTGHAWVEPLDFELDAAAGRRVEQFLDQIAHVAEHLPDAWMARRRLMPALADASDLVRFTRVQGVSLGGGVVWRPGPAFTTVLASARFGTADARVSGGVTWRREAPAGRFTLGVYREVAQAEPWTDGLSLGNSLNALFTGHDDADYHLAAVGARLTWAPYRGPLAGFTVALAAERQRSMVTRSGSALNDVLGGEGALAPNPPIAEGDWLIGTLSRRIQHRLVGATLGVSGMLGGAGAGRGARGWIDARIPFRVMGRSGALSLKAGTTAGDPLPQLGWRLGGPHTVRGYAYGTVVAPDVWAAQLDVALRRSWWVSPVVFADVGDVDLAGEPLVGVGAGLSLFGGWLRFNLAAGLNPSERVRFDLLFGAPR